MTAPDIEALVIWLRTLKEKGGKGVVGNIDARALGRVADALERTQAVVKAARRDYCQVVGKFDDCRATLAHTYEMLTGNEPTPPKSFKGSWYKWLVTEVEKALAALDAKPEGKKE